MLMMVISSHFVYEGNGRMTLQRDYHHKAMVSYRFFILLQKLDCMVYRYDNVSP